MTAKNADPWRLFAGVQIQSLTILNGLRGPTVGIFASRPGSEGEESGAPLRSPVSDSRCRLSGCHVVDFWSRLHSDVPAALFSVSPSVLRTNLPFDSLAFCPLTCNFRRAGRKASEHHENQKHKTLCCDFSEHVRGSSFVWSVQVLHERNRMT